MYLLFPIISTRRARSPFIRLTGLRPRHRAHHRSRPGQVPPMPRWCRVPPTPKGIRSRSSRNSIPRCCSCQRQCRAHTLLACSLARPPCLSILAAHSLAHPLDLDLVSLHSGTNTSTSARTPRPPFSSTHPPPPSCCSRTASIRISSSISSPASASLHTFSFRHITFLPQLPYGYILFPFLRP